MNYRIVTKQPVDFISINEAKTQLNILHDREDTYIQSVLDSAIDLAEGYTNRKFSLTTVKIKLNEYQYLEPPFAPISEITSVLDENGNPVEYTYDEFSNTLDVTGDFSEFVIVTYDCGYTNNHPASLKMGVLKLVSTLYEFREDIVAGASVSEISLTATKVLDRARLYNL